MKEDCSKQVDYLSDIVGWFEEWQNVHGSSKGLSAQTFEASNALPLIKCLFEKSLT